MKPVYIILVILVLAFLIWKYIDYLKATRGTEGYAKRRMAYLLFIAFMSFIGITSVFAEAIFEFFKLERPQYFEIISLIAFGILALAFVFIARSGGTQKEIIKVGKQENTDGDNIAGDKNVQEDKSRGIQADTYIEKQIIQQTSPPRQQPKTEIKNTTYLTELPSLSEELIGRKADITTLETTLEQTNQVVLMNGMGGIGKTTLVTHYANKHKGSYDYIAWIEQLGDFASDVATNTLLLKNLNIEAGGEAREVAKLVLNTLTNLPGKGLLVIDNADEHIKPFSNFLPKAPNWQVLLTSREELSFAKKVALDFMLEADALALFYQHYTLDKDDTLAKKILKYVDYHTLTLEILAKTAQNLGIDSLKKIADLLEEKGIQLGKPVDFSTVAHKKGEEKHQGLFPYLKVVFQMGELDEEEVFLLKQFIALPPSFTSWDLIMQLLDVEDDDEKEKLTFIRNKMLKKGWLLEEKNQHAYKMHRIIQDVLVEQLKPVYKDVKDLILEITAILEMNQSKDNPVEKFPFIPFGEHIIALELTTDDHSFSLFQNNLGLVFRVFGDYQKAKELLEKSVILNEQHFNEGHPMIALSYSNLAVVLQDLGNYEGARDLLEKAMLSNEKTFGLEHPATTIRYSNLAIVLKELGDYGKAKELLEKALFYNIRNFGEDDPRTITYYSNLAMVLQKLGNHQGSKYILEKVMDSDIQNFGPLHPNTAKSYSNLALALCDLGDYKRAKDLLEKAINSDEKNFGSSHPNTVRDYSNLAIVLQNLGDYKRARNLFENALACDKQNFGLSHPITAKGYFNLAFLLKDIKDYKGAKDLLKESLQIFEGQFGIDHPDTLSVKRSYEFLLQEIERNSNEN